MGEHEWLAERSGQDRGHLRTVAYRMLGSLNEAEGAVQEASIVGRSPDAARQLASRARRRAPRGTSMRFSHFSILMSCSGPTAPLRLCAPTEVSGAAAVAKRAVVGSARAARTAIVNGDVGVIVAPRGRLLMVLRFTITNRRIVEIEAVVDPRRARELDLAVL